MVEQSNLTQQRSATTADTCQLRVWTGETWREFAVNRGTNLRSALVAEGLSPHNWVTQYLNCQGHGLCGTCTVRVEGDVPPPTQWLDRMTAKFSSRLSCQMTIDRDMTILL